MSESGSFGTSHLCEIVYLCYGRMQTIFIFCTCISKWTTVKMADRGEMFVQPIMFTSESLAQKIYCMYKVLHHPFSLTFHNYSTVLYFCSRLKCLFDFMCMPLKHKITATDLVWKLQESWIFQSGPWLLTQFHSIRFPSLLHKGCLPLTRIFPVVFQQGQSVNRRGCVQRCRLSAQF